MQVNIAMLIDHGKSGYADRDGGISGTEFCHPIIHLKKKKIKLSLL